MSIPGFYDRAACLGRPVALFFPERGRAGKEARRICGGCEVREECLEYALERPERWGTWGGLDEEERRELRRQRQRRASRERVAS